MGNGIAIGHGIEWEYVDDEGNHEVMLGVVEQVGTTALDAARVAASVAAGVRNNGAVAGILGNTDNNCGCVLTA